MSMVRKKNTKKMFGGENEKNDADPMVRYLAIRLLKAEKQLRSANADYENKIKQKEQLHNVAITKLEQELQKMKKEMETNPFSNAYYIGQLELYDKIFNKLDIKVENKEGIAGIVNTENPIIGSDACPIIQNENIKPNVPISDELAKAFECQFDYIKEKMKDNPEEDEKIKALRTLQETYKVKEAMEQYKNSNSISQLQFMNKLITLYSLSGIAKDLTVKFTGKTPVQLVTELITSIGDKIMPVVKEMGSHLVGGDGGSGSVCSCCKQNRSKKRKTVKKRVQMTNV